ncbi:hypothetical protein GN316_07550 [Xylophilus sp. Kf1]|nr:hypothetical protein [Xylophilus sp. Kf1]
MIPAIRSCLIASCLLASNVWAVEWFTVIGIKNDPNVDTAQLDVSTITRRGPATVLRFRVNLAEPRKLPSGETYQSYVSFISIDCNSMSVFHEEQTRYGQPYWAGSTAYEKFAQPKPMAFGGLAPDPKPRILNAACRSQFRPF